MILVVGAGFLGTYLLKYLSRQSGEPALAAVRDPAAHPQIERTEYIKCDIREKEDVAALYERCAGQKLTVFYFAALHNVDYLYEHPGEGRAVNIDALSRFLDVFPNIEKLFFASTDCVYGENPPDIVKFKETDATVPVNEYGKQKLEAEKIVLKRGFTAVRFSYMLGPSPLQKRHFYDNISEKLLSGKSVEMINGMVRSALSYETAAMLLAKLSRLPAADVSGIINLCSDGEYTKYDLGLLIARTLGVSPDLVCGISEEQAKGFFKDRRASRSVMDNSKLKSLLGIDAVPLEV
ncbi:MAG: sugar nucleotide-binding protein [Clostridia bacterium]|nr:sugar nucleotide-binding protein [Clostridia bacterium]